MGEVSGIIPFSNVIQSPPVDTTTPINYDDLAGKVILITGGASGFGAAWLREWAPHKPTIIIGDLNEASGQSLIADVRKSSKNKDLHFLKLDVTSWTSQVSFFRESVKISRHGGIDAVIANAGIADARESEIFENPPDYSKMKEPPTPTMKTLEVNLNGVMYTTTLAISYLSQNPGSVPCSLDSDSSQPRDRHLLLVSSMAGLSALPTQSIYSASKHGVVGLFRSLRVSSPLTHGVRINMLHPYFVETAILGREGALALAGGGIAQLQDVVEAASRCVADQRIIGRGLIIGPKAGREDVALTGMDASGMKERDEIAVWDSYSHDFEQSDVFTRRVIGLTNLRAGRKGVLGLMRDIIWAFTPASVRRSLGY